MGRLMIRAVLIALAGTLAGQAAAVEWNVSLSGQRSAFSEHVHRLAELVEQKTDGGFTMNISYGGLSSERENLDGISIGAFEMAQFCAGYHADKNPTLTVLELPFLGVSSLEEERAVSDAVYSHPAVAKDLGRWNARLLMPSPLPPSNLMGAGTPPRSLEDFGGMRVGAAGGMAAAFEMAGAVPAALTLTEAHDAMESGVVDAVALPPHAHLTYRTLDLATWWTGDLDVGTMNCPIVVSIDAYDALTADERAALDGSIDEAIAHYIAGYDELLSRWDSILDRRDVERVAISDADLAAFHELAVPIRDRWIADMEAQGIPGSELYMLVERSLEEYRRTN